MNIRAKLIDINKLKALHAGVDLCGFLVEEWFVLSG
jgi:hypothetical protein